MKNHRIQPKHGEMKLMFVVVVALLAYHLSPSTAFGQTPDSTKDSKALKKVVPAMEKKVLKEVPDKKKCVILGFANASAPVCSGCGPDSPTLNSTGITDPNTKVGQAKFDWHDSNRDRGGWVLKSDGKLPASWHAVGLYKSTVWDSCQLGIADFKKTADGMNFEAAFKYVIAVGID